VSSSQVPAARRTLDVLRYLATQPRPVAAATMARELSIPRSTLYHLLAVLEDERFVTHLPEERRYGLGVAAFEIGSAYLRHDGLERLSRPLLRRLVNETGAAGHLGVLDGRETLYLLEEAPPQPQPLVTDVGVRLPAHLTASGRAMLAHLPAAQLDALFPSDRALATRTGVGPTTRAGLRRCLAEERERGWAVEEEEVTEGFLSVAAAAFDHTGRPVAAFAVTVPACQVEPAFLAPPVARCAAELTRRLGGRAPELLHR
jgi:DNA-binding IclR family transcriptional regulator